MMRRSRSVILCTNKNLAQKELNPLAILSEVRILKILPAKYCK
jgi:hypothetical protein